MRNHHSVTKSCSSENVL